MKNISIALLVFAIFTSLNGQDNEHYFQFRYNQLSELDKLTRLISIDDVRGDTVFAYANNEQWHNFQRMGYSYKELPHPSSLYEHVMTDDRMNMIDWDRYPTYQAYLAMMRQFAIDYPTICKLDTIGNSVQGRQILAVKISDNVNQNENEPEFFYTSTMHGDETVGYILMLRLTDYLLTQYGLKTPEGLRVKNLVNNLEIWINPLANPDGTYRLGADTTVSKATRNNANGIDLNRNFPDRINNPNNTTVGRQTETKVMMEFVWKHNFILSANFHGGAQVVNYPWDNGAASGTYSASPDDAWFINLSRAYATPNPDIMSGGFTNGITNGCNWYAIFGGRQDWMYWWQGGRETTIELWNTKNPPGSALPARWTNNKESLLAYMELALKGIRGTVTDFHTDLPIRARVDVLGKPNVPVFTDSTVGDFYRLLQTGTYDLRVSATGYLPDTLFNINVTDTAMTQVAVALRSSSVGVTENIPEMHSKYFLSDNYPNPFNPLTIINYQLPIDNWVTLKVYDILGREVATLVDDWKEAGRYEIEWNGTDRSSGASSNGTYQPSIGQGYASGVFFYRLCAGNFTQTKKLLLLK